MSGQKAVKPDYGNWVSKRLIYISGLIGVVFLGASILFLPLIILAILFFLVALYFVYARYLFSPWGGNVQSRIWDLVLEHLEWNGEGPALDIGCGNAALTIKLARKYPKASVMGIDYWGAQWDYSKMTCERNAEIEGVKGRVSFQKASASKLPFEDGYFDAVVSNLTFHEVSDAPDKREVIREALRVVKKGGKFAFQDLFLEKRIYGDTDDLVRTIQSWGINKVEFVKTRDAPFIPGALKLPFMVGTMGIISGKK
jgi:SAM-dependent methyltransferase